MAATLKKIIKSPYLSSGFAIAMKFAIVTLIPLWTAVAVKILSF